jgi:hypothetical protein
VTTNQEKLEELFEAALRSLDKPLERPVPASRENMFSPPPWRAQEETQAKPKIFPELKTEEV